MARRRSGGPLPRAAHGGGSSGALVHVHIGTRSGPAAASSSVDRSRQNAALGRDRVRRRGRAHCRIGDAVVQGRAKVITMMRIKLSAAVVLPVCARDERGERARQRPDVPLSGRDGARGRHGSDETGGHGRHADLWRPSLASHSTLTCSRPSPASGCSPRPAKRPAPP